MQAFIKAIAYYLPEKELTNNELAALFPEWSVEKIAGKIGIETRHIAADNEHASDMAIAAAHNLFGKHNINPAEIDFLLYCTQSPDYHLPATACIIQDKLGLPVTAGALDFNLGCSGYIYGLALAKGLVASGIATNILLITADTYSKYLHSLDKGNRTIFGDAATASLISTSGIAEIGAFSLGTDGSGAENLIVKQGGARYPVKSGVAVSDAYGNASTDANLYMNGPEIFAFTAAEIPKLVENALQKNQVEQTDIGQFIFHQANEYLLNHLRKKLGIDTERFYIDLAQVGNTVSSTVPIAIAEAMKKQKPVSGAKWLLAGFGVGYSWGATVITFK